MSDLTDLPFSVRLGLAQNPATLPEDLQALYDDSRVRMASSLQGRGNFWQTVDQSAAPEEVRIAEMVAAHPNTPPRLLATLAHEYPEAFCRNPILPLITLEEPAFVSWMNVSGLRSLMGRADLPGTIVGAIAGMAEDEDLRQEARLHVAYAGEAGKEWRQEMRAALTAQAERVGRQDPAARTTLLRMVALGLAPDWLVKEEQEVARLEATLPPQNLRPALRRALIAKVLAERGPELHVCRCFALAELRPRLGEELRSFAQSPVWQNRLGVAMNPYASAWPGILAVLAEEGNSLVRAAARETLWGSQPIVTSSA